MQILSRLMGTTAYGLATGCLAALVLACGGTAPTGDPGNPGNSGNDAGTPVPGVDGGAPPAVDSGQPPPPSKDAGTPHPDATTPPGVDAGPPPPPAADGGVTRNPKCAPSSQWTGNIINTPHGRLDGTLVFVVPAGKNGCDSDASHLHLQVSVSGTIYDVAVDVGTTDAGNGVGWYEETAALPGASGAWAEGWHGSDGLSYRALSLSPSQFTDLAPPDVSTELMTLLESTSQVSVFCTSYTSGNGCHDVHYKNSSAGDDGAIVLDPLSAKPHMVFLRFQNQTSF